MSVIDKIDEFLSEAWDDPKFGAGKWVVQRRGSDNEWGMLVAQMKNGAWSVISKSDETVGGNAKKGSTKGWYPAPELVDEKEVPQKIKDKILKKAKQLNVKV